MPIGILNPIDTTHSSSTRPARGNTGVNQRRWYSSSLNTEIRDQDLNDLIAQIRYACDFYSILDVEGDDTMLQKAMASAATTLTGNIALLQGLTGAADKVPYFTGASSMSTFTATSYSRGLLANTNLAQWQSALGVTAISSPNVIALGNLVSSADQLPYFNGAGTMAMTLFQAYGRTLVGAVDAAAARTTLGLGSAATMPSTAFLTSADLAPYAPLASPALTGNPTAPTQLSTDNSTRLATTAYVTTALVPKANLVGPTFTGTPSAPTAAPGTNTTQIATTAFVATSFAPLASPALTGTPIAPTAAPGTNTTQLATTAFVTTALIPKADLASPTFTGVPAAPTAVAGTSTTQIATTAFVTTAIATGGGSYQPLDAELTALAGLVSAADRLPYFTGSAAAALTVLTTFGRSLIDDVDATAARSTLGLGSLATLSALTLSALSDTTISSPATGQYLRWNGTVWVNGPGILDTATAARVAITTTIMQLGDPVTSTIYTVGHKFTDSTLYVSGSNSPNLGANVQLWGDTSVNAGRGVLRSSATAYLRWDPTLFIDSLAQHKFIDGTVSLPGIAFTSDPDNGLRRIGANNWSLVVNGADALTFLTTSATFATTVFSDGAIVARGGQLQVDRTGDAVASQIFIDGDAGQARSILARTGALNRWTINMADGTAEGGSNAGSNWYITRYNDAGVAIDVVLQFIRSTGIAAFTYSPTAPTLSPGTNTTQLATTAFVAAAVATGGGAFMPLSGGTFTGTVHFENDANFKTMSSAGPPIQRMIQFSAGANNNTYVGADITDQGILIGVENTGGTISNYLFMDITSASLDKSLSLNGGAPTLAAHATRKDYVDAADALKAPLANPTFTGVPAAPTAAPGTNTTQLATTAFVTTADNLKANLAGPTFTGVPAAPTAAPGTNTTQLATTAFVTGAISTAGGTYQPLDADLTAIAALVPAANGQMLRWNGTSWGAGLGILDTAGGQRLLLSNNQAAFGNPTTSAAFTLCQVASDIALYVSGSTGPNLGANIILWGETSASPGRGQIRSTVTTYLRWDPTLFLDSLVAHGFIDGTLALPGLAFTSDLDTGIRRIGANNWSLVAGGVDIAVLTATGINFPLLPSGPTATAGTNTTQLATTAYVVANVPALTLATPLTGFTIPAASAVVAADTVLGAFGKLQSQFNAFNISVTTNYAPLASPTFTGTPVAPTAAPGTNTTQLATTAFVAASFAPLASPTFTGTPAAPTATAGTNTTQIATTAYVVASVPALTLATPLTGLTTPAAAAIAATDTVLLAFGKLQSQFTTFNTAVTTNYALLASPTFTGVPAAPTAAPGTNTTQLATTAFVTAAVSTAGGTYQPLDSELTAIAGLVSAADRLPYFTGSNAAALATFTAFGRTLVDDADATTARGTLGLGTAATQNTGTTGAVIPFTNGANNWTALQTITLAASGNALACVTADDTANTGPNILLRRTRTIQTAGDLLGEIQFGGIDSVGGIVARYASIRATITDPTTTAHDGSLQFMTAVAGNATNRAIIADGMYMIGATGTDKGSGTFNAVALYEQGTLISAKYAPLASPTFTGTLTAATLVATSVTANTLTASQGDITVDRVGDASNAQVNIAGDAGFVKDLVFKTGANSRWVFRTTTAAEAGASAGSNFSFISFDDAGASLGSVFDVVRATRILTFLASPLAPTPTAGDNTTKLATTAFVAASFATTASVAAGYQPLDADLTAIAALVPAVTGYMLRWSGTAWTAGVGIVDTAIGQRLSLGGGQASFGDPVTAATNYTLCRILTDGNLYLSGSNGPNTGANIILSGETAANPSRILIRNATTVYLRCDPTSNIDSLVAHGFTDGTLALPGLAFSTDLNNGLRRIGNDNWSLVAGGVDIISLTATTITLGVALAGTPAAPTAAAGTNTTQIATTAFVATAAGNATSYTNAGKPTASTNTGKTIFVSDYLGGVTAISDGTDWVVAVETMMVAIGDETTTITTGTAKITKRMPYKGKHARVPRAELNTVSSSGLPTFDIKKNGVTIFSTLLTIDASEKTSVTAATAAVVSVSTFADDDEFTFDITVAGTGAKGAKIAMVLKHIL